MSPTPAVLIVICFLVRTDALQDRVTTVPHGVTRLERLQQKHQVENENEEAAKNIAAVHHEDSNVTELGEYLGSPCEFMCNPDLPNVFCDQITRHCECEKKFPVRLGPTKGCAKPVRLGDQCYYRQACTFTDQHATCIQINHNAICQCKPGYHTVALQRPTKRVFCSQDLVLLTTDVPTLFGVATGLAIFTALMCFVLKLFSRARYSRPRHYANANLAPPMIFSSETGIPLAVHGGRPSSRASSQRSVGTFTSGFSRRPSSGGSRGVLVPASRAGAARAAAILLISCHLTTNSATTAATTAHDDVLEADDDVIDDDDDDDDDAKLKHDDAETAACTGKTTSGDEMPCVIS